LKSARKFVGKEVSNQMMKRNEHDDVEDDEETSPKKQRLDDMALVTLPGSLELSASGTVREKVSKNILQSSTVLLTGHTEAIYSIAFDPSGMHLASASMDRTISELWRLTSFVSYDHRFQSAVF
jgi:WD40 repeat protein